MPINIDNRIMEGPTLVKARSAVAVTVTTVVAFYTVSTISIAISGTATITGIAGNPRIQTIQVDVIVTKAAKAATTVANASITKSRRIAPDYLI